MKSLESEDKKLMFGTTEKRALVKGCKERGEWSKQQASREIISAAAFRSVMSRARLHL